MLIFFDIDGTLIDEKNRIMPESAKRAVAKARENGHICMINTGRTKRLVGEEITGQAGFDGLLLGCGTMITYHGETMLHKTFSAELSARIQEGLRRHGIDAVLEGRENNYIQQPDKIFHSSFVEFLKRFKDFGYGSYEEAVGHFDKFYAYVEHRSSMRAFAEEFAGELEFIDRLEGYFEVMPKGCSKASAMEFVANALHIPMEETAAVGDSSNDIPMLKCARYGIAMGNGTEEVKKLAAYVTTDVEEDGIWNALKWLKVI